MSTNILVLPVSKVDINNITFVQNSPRAKNPGIPGISIRHNGQNLKLILPRMTSTFGASSPTKGDPGPKTNLSMTLTGCDPNGIERADESTDVGRFYNFLIDLQDKILNAAISNIKWFPLRPNKTKLTEDDIRNNMKPMLKVNSSGKYAPFITLKIPIYDNDVSMDIIDNRGRDVYVTPTTLEKVFPPKVEANLVASPSIYIMAGGAFGVSWRLNYAQVFPMQRVTAADVFAEYIDDACDDEEEVLPTPAPHAPALSSENTALDIEVPEDDSISAAAPAPAPAPAPAAPAPAPSVRRRRPAGSVV